MFESSWSAFARSAPFIEQGSFYNAINFNFTYSDPPNTTVAVTPLPFLYARAIQGRILTTPRWAIRDTRRRATGRATATGTSGRSIGDPQFGRPDESLFGPNYSRRIAMVTDGLSNTLMASEGLIGHAQMRSCMKTPSVPSDPITGTWSPTNVPPPGPVSLRRSLVDRVVQYEGAKVGGPIGHTRWCNGGVYYSGFTTAMPPNAAILAVSQATIKLPDGTTVPASNGGQVLPMDWDSVDENDGGPTYMSLTASSNHPGGVNAVFGDGSVRWVKNTIDPIVWRNLGTIAGDEVVSADQY